MKFIVFFCLQMLVCFKLLFVAGYPVEKRFFLYFGMTKFQFMVLTCMDKEERLLQFSLFNYYKKLVYFVIRFIFWSTWKINWLCTVNCYCLIIDAKEFAEAMMILHTINCFRLSINYRKKIATLAINLCIKHVLYISYNFVVRKSRYSRRA